MVSKDSNIRNESFAQVVRQHPQVRNDAYLAQAPQNQPAYIRPDTLAIDLEIQMQHEEWVAYNSQAQNNSLNALYTTSNPTPQSMSNEIGSNPNYNPDMTDTANGLAGWNRQTRNIGDRTVLSLDMSRLQPAPSPYTPLSPASVTSATSSRPSRKRNREEMRSGNCPFTCVVCDAGFYTSADLWHHFRYHEGRLWICNTCGKDFTFEKDLKRHCECVHDAEARKYLCPYAGCTNTYKRKDHLSRHVNNRHASDSGIGPSRQTSVLNGN